MKRIYLDTPVSFVNALLSEVYDHPKLTPCDAVKFIYQSSFGYEAITNTVHFNSPVQRVTDINEKYSRLYLTDDSYKEISDILLEETKKGQSNEKCQTDFEFSLNILRELVKDGKFPFDLYQLEVFLDEYLSFGMPCLTHSDIYKSSYDSSYITLRRESALLFPLICDIFISIKERGHAVVVIDGTSASGKTTTAEYLVKFFPARIIHMDDFFLPPEKRTALRLLEPGGNVDYERFYNEVVRHLSDGSLTHGIFDCSKKAITKTAKLSKEPLTIIEGAYSRHPNFRKYYDISVFMKTSEEKQRERILSRNGKLMLKMFEDKWIPYEKKYDKVFEIEKSSDYLIVT